MNAFSDTAKVTAAFSLQATIAFGVSFVGVLGGIVFDEARMERLIAEHNPFTSAS